MSDQNKPEEQADVWESIEKIAQDIIKLIIRVVKGEKKESPK
jgi:hypothetical protein